MPQRARRAGRERMPDPNAIATMEGVSSTINGEDLPIPCTSDVPFEQVCVGPLLGNDILQLPHCVFVGLDTEADRVDPVPKFSEHVGSTSTSDLPSFE